MWGAGNVRIGVDRSLRERGLWYVNAWCLGVQLREMEVWLTRSWEKGVR
jgi:hypothetical protein